MATAVASAVLGINPFDQPNVQAAKTATDRLMKVVEEQGSLPEKSQPVATEDGVAYYSRRERRGRRRGAEGVLRPGPARRLPLPPGLPDRNARRKRQPAGAARPGAGPLHIATTSGYGPRFLHSTGQYHKGGPDTGLFVQFTADNPQDLALPGRSYTFGTFKNAQAQGDLEALHSYHRRTLRVHLGADAEKGLKKMLAALDLKA